MSEIDIKIKEIEKRIATVEYEACKLLDYGNVPKGNYDAALGLLEDRNRLKIALKELKSVRFAINSNKTTRTK